MENNIQDNSFLSVYYATLGGARSLFIDEKVGSIEKEKDADLLCIKFGDDKPLDPYMTVISSESNNIEYSMVKGKFLYKKNDLQ